jgi:hypothetical protein
VQIHLLELDMQLHRLEKVEEDLEFPDLPKEMLLR